MKKSAVFLLVLLCLAPLSIFTVNSVKAQYAGSITIDAGGNISPSAAPIQQNGSIYTFTDNVKGYLVVEKSNIIINGGNFTIEGTGPVGVHSAEELGPWTGVQLQHVTGVTVRNLRIQNFLFGIALPTNCTISGNFIGYNKEGITKVSNTTITGNQIVYNEDGVYCPDTVNWGNTIVGNTIANNNDGINLMNMMYNLNLTGRNSNYIAQNNITGSSLAGINLMGSVGNVILENNISDTSPGVGFNVSAQIGSGLVFIGSQSNSIIGNRITGNRYGMFFGSHSNNNLLYNNVFDNPQQFFIASQQYSVNGSTSTDVFVERWDNGSMGNRWSDYKGVDANGDGIGDSPYVIDQNNRDNFPIAPMQAYISISTASLETTAGSAVKVYGKLYDTLGNLLQNETVLLSYSFPGASATTVISSGTTDQNGNYNIQWINSASGTFTLHVAWFGNAKYGSTGNSTTLSFLPIENQQVFYVESNSTITELAYNSTSSELSFTASGPSGTTGYVKVTIAKNLVPNAANMKVYLDGNSIDYSVTEQANSWQLTFNYHHSSHRLTVYLPAGESSGNSPQPSASNPTTQPSAETNPPTASPTNTTANVDYAVWVTAIVGIAAAIIACGVVLKRRKPI